MKNLRQRLGLFLIKKISRDNHSKRTIIPYDKASSIGILFDATDEENSRLVEGYARQLALDNKKVKKLGFFDKAKLPEDLRNSDTPYFTRKNVNWKGLPKMEEVSNFINEKFDILLNLYPKNKFPLLTISAYSKARFRVGRYGKLSVYCFDFMIDTGNEHNLKNIIDQLDFYLKSFKNEH